MSIHKFPLVAVAITCSTFSLNAATTWNAAQDFITNETSVTETSNPNGQVPEWRYGYRDSILSTSLTLFPTVTHTNSHQSDPRIQGWESGFMVTAANVSMVTSSGLAPGEMFVHPLSNSANPTYNVIRWTAPTAGTYDISASWTALSLATGPGNDGVDVHIVVNGASNYNGTSAFGVTANSGLQTLILSAGATVEFVVGPGSSGNNQNDSTRFNANITLVPEPSSVLLLGAAVPLLLRRRRSNG